MPMPTPSTMSARALGLLRVCRTDVSRTARWQTMVPAPYVNQMAEALMAVRRSALRFVKQPLLSSSAGAHKSFHHTCCEKHGKTDKRARYFWRLTDVVATRVARPDEAAVKRPIDDLPTV
jgi:hypothetical protein